MDYSLIIPLCTALAIGLVVFASIKSENNKKSWKEVLKSHYLIILVFIVGAFLFMKCTTSFLSDTGHNDSEFNWNGKPKDQYRFLRKKHYQIHLYGQETPLPHSGSR